MTGFIPEMAYIGTLSGVGDARVFGLARHVLSEDRADTIYLNLAGPATTVESIWARILEGQTLTFMPHDKSISPTPLKIRHGGLGTDETPYTRFAARIPGLALDHLLLLDRRFGSISYGEAGTAFVFNKEDAFRKVFEHIHQLVNLACFPQWAGKLTQLGYQAGLIRAVQSLGGQDIYQINLDRTLWEQQIMLGLERGHLPWPDAANQPVIHSQPAGEILGAVMRASAPSASPASTPQPPAATDAALSYTISHKWLNDYQQFLALYGVSAGPEELFRTATIEGLDLYCGWVTGSSQYLSV